MFKRIVVPLDGSPFGEHALRFATAIAGPSGAAIELVHVHIPEHFSGSPESITAFRYQGVTGFEAGVDHDALRHEADRLAASAASLQREVGVPVTSRVVAGRVGPALEHEAAAFHADLIVMATHARGGYDRVRLGSVGDTITRMATMPILFVRPPQVDRPAPEPAFGNILVPLDGSDLSEQILDPAIELALLFGGRLSVFHLLPYAVPRLHFSGRLMADADQMRTVFGAEYLESILNRITPRLPAVDGEIVPSGQPAAAILDAAAQRGADIVAMATHGRGGVSRLLFGSTTDAVLRASRRPMLVVRPRAAVAPLVASGTNDQFATA
jgi:nucleotide-binding universal stress UspA family protein